MPRHLLLILALLGLLAVFLLLASGCLRTEPATDRPPEPMAGEDLGAFVARPPVFEAEGVRLATLNAEFLFDGLDGEGQADFPWKGAPEAARAHRDRVAEIVRMLDADMVVMQEVENGEVLEMMIAESLGGLGYAAHFVPGRDTFTGQDVAVLARVPVEAVGRTDERARVAGTRDEYGVSKNVWARLDLGGVPTTVVGVHFLARPDDAERKPRREAQAEVIRRLVEAEMTAGRAVAVLGDFNDFDSAVPDRAGSAPITDVLETVAEAGPGPEDDLINVIGEVPQAERFTAFWDRNRNDAIDAGELSALDHVLLSPRLYGALREVTFVHAHDPRRGPDHFPVVATLGLN